MAGWRPFDLTQLPPFFLTAPRQTAPRLGHSRLKTKKERRNEPTFLPIYPFTPPIEFEFDASQQSEHILCLMCGAGAAYALIQQQQLASQSGAVPLRRRVVGRWMGIGITKRWWRQRPTGKTQNGWKEARKIRKNASQPAGWPAK